MIFLKPGDEGAHHCMAGALELFLSDQDRNFYVFLEGHLCRVNSQVRLMN